MFMMSGTDVSGSTTEVIRRRFSGPGSRRADLGGMIDGSAERERRPVDQQIFIISREPCFDPLKDLNFGEPKIA